MYAAASINISADDTGRCQKTMVSLIYNVAEVRDFGIC